MQKQLSSASPPLAQRFLSSHWYHALTLDERQAALRACPPGHGSGNWEPQTRRLQKWRSQAPFTDEAYFQERLRSAGLSEAEFLLLLSEPASSLQAHVAGFPAWLTSLQAAFVAPDVESAELALSASPEFQPIIDTLMPLRPLLVTARRRLLTGLTALAERYASLPFDPPSITNSCLLYLLERFFLVASKTFTLELHIARLQDRLSGSTPEERFRSFIRQLGEPEALAALLEEYPVLARQLVTLSEHWLTYALEVLEHLCADWSEICRIFAPERQPGQLRELHFGSGDTHQQGRSVLRLEFTSGLKLIYKPRSLAVDTHFQHLLDWLNARGVPAPFLTLKLLERGSYGWSEYVEPASCQDEAELKRFYLRQGGYLAILHALCATDVHFENLIARGEHPVLIDLEALFQPDLQESVSAREQTPALAPDFQLLRASVLRTHLLPARSWVQRDGESVDISGLSGRGGQLTPQPVARFTGVGTDEARLVRQRVKMPDRQNRPTLRGQEVETLNYREDVARGFTQVYRLLLEQREAFLREVFPLFEHDTLRVIPRPTQTYMHVLQESWHPSLLRNELERQRFLDHLWLTVPAQPGFARLIASEQEDLRAGNIPFFTTRADSLHLYDSQGRCISEFFARPCLEQARQQIFRLGEADLDQQLWLLNASFAALTENTGKIWWKPSRLVPVSGPLPRQRFLSAACAVADCLLTRALHSAAGSTWLDLQLVQERHWQIAPLGMDLYSGSGGICFFLAYLGAVTADERYTALARQLWQQLQRQIEQLGDQELPLGALNGWGGYLYLVTHLAALWQDPHLLEQAEDYLPRIARLIPRDTTFDVIGGAAGCLLGLLALYRSSGSTSALALALACGEHLLAQAQPQVCGLAWSSAQFEHVPLAGFSHGAAGIALSLLQLSAASGDERFRAVAREALTYERGLFDQTKQNWPDLRPLSAGGHSEQQMLSWCHGAPGIGMARLAALPWLEEKEARAEIEAALATTLRRGFGQNHSLCHGDLGNLELFLSAAHLLREPAYGETAAKLAASILESIEQQGWCSGVPLGIEVPGLMTGLAGIGYGLLRCAAPEQTPALLLLASPPNNTPREDKR